jgi:Flp pilus assembly protein protease CpaA
MQMLVISILAYIALIDLRTHRIPNREVLVLSIVSLTSVIASGYSFRSHFLSTLIVLLLSGLLSVFCGLGMGDVKVLGVLAIFVLPPETASYKIFLFTVAITATVHAIFLSRGDLRRSLQIPLAPAILCGTIATLILK